MTEDFLHYAWRTQNFNHDRLTTTNGLPIKIHQYGHWNKDSGPDFLNAKIQIDEQLWAGHVEIHVQEREWFEHNHHLDSAYNNTILHVCHEQSLPAVRTDGTAVQCLILKDRIPKRAFLSYRRLMEGPGELPCAKLHARVDDVHKNIWLERMHTERLAEHAERVHKMAQHTKNDWRELLFKKISGSFGLRVNKEAFEMLADQIGYKMMLQNSGNLQNLEALLFGVAGFFGKKLLDAYGQELQHTFHFLKSKYDLRPLPVHIWKFMRLRPAGFPTIRISQFAHFLHTNPDFFSAFENAMGKKDMYHVLNCRAHEYWDTHYRFDQKSTKSEKKVLGKSHKNSILINAIAPTFFAYYRGQNLGGKTQQMADLLHQLPLENNKIIREFRAMGFPIQNAAHGQGCLHLKRNYCNFKLCLQCSIGHQIINKQKPLLE
jgi:hypothetical protein